VIFIVSFCVLLYAEESTSEDSSIPDIEETTSDDQPQSIEGDTGGGTLMTTTTLGQQPYISTEKFQVEPSTGTATLTIPIDVAQGRKGIQPTINLMYNSSSPNGILGVGWGLELGSIQRSTKRGVPTYNNSQDTFVLAQQGSTQELVPIGGNQYRAKIEGAFMKFELISNSDWVVTDKKGIRYCFGSTPDSRISQPGNPYNIFKWCLDRVEDLNGNYMLVTYLRDQNQIYPQHIYYTGNSITGDSTFADVEFIYEDRADTTLSYRTGFAVTTAKRLQEINIYVDGQLQRGYQLDYEYSASTSRSLLASITQYGADGVSVLPATSFAYTEQVPNWTRDNNWMISEDYQGEAAFGDHNGICDGDLGVRLADVNNDGFIDIPKHVEWAGNVNKIYKNNRDRTWSEAEWSFPNIAAFNWRAPEINRDRGVRFGDVNGDGWVDLVRHWEDCGHGIVLKPFINNRTNGWYLDHAWDMPDGTQFTAQRGCPQYEYAEFLGVVFNDINADGYQDVIKSHGSDRRTYLNNAANGGTGWSRDSDWDLPDGADLTQGTTLVDLNGDGLSDIVVSKGGNNYRAWLNQGPGWLDYPDYYPPEGNIKEGDTQLVDVNADGLPDLLIASNDTHSTYLNTGSGWQRAPEWDMPGGNFHNFGTRLGDANADGIIDIIKYWKNDNEWRIYLNNGPYPDLLYQINNGVGSTTTIQYTPSTQYDNTGDDDISDLPFPVQTVSSVTVTDQASGQSYTTTYEYRDGLWDWQDREFRGFGWVRTEQGNLATNPSFEIWSDGSDDAPDGWNAVGEVHRDSENKKFGSYSVAITDTGGGADIYGGISSSVYEDLLGEYVSVGCWVKASQPNQAQLSVCVCSAWFYSDYHSGSGEWEFLTIPNIYIGEEAPCARIYLGVGQSGTAYFDGVVLTKGVGLKDYSYTETEFLQGDYNKGRIKEQRTYDAQGNLYTKVINDWQEQDLGNNSHFVYLAQTHNYTYDGDNTFKQTTTQYEYDSYGNVTRVAELGDVDITGDERYSYTEYTYNESNWLVSLPKTTYIKDHTDSNIVKQSWFYYDDNDSLDDPPTQGLLTKQEDWLDGADNPLTQFSYDTYGNLLTTTDALGHTTTVSYDSTYHMFPLITTNALGHQVVNEYYGVDDVPLDDGTYRGLWGQTKSSTDPNGNTSHSIYDTFGRIERQVSPEDSIDYPTASYEYDLTTIPLRITSHQRELSGQEGTLDTVQFYDGLGRLIQTKSESEETNKFIVSGQTEYNSRGLPEKKYLPKFTTNPIDSMDPIDPTDPHTSISYDAIGRIIQTTNPDGTYSTIQYNDWTTTTIDENGHMQKSYFDAYGRLKEKREYTGADGRSPYYPYSDYTLYATTLYIYDTLGNLIQTQDAHNNITTITYDTLGRKTSMSDPDMGTWTYEYDAVGNLISQTDAKQRTIEFQYDEINRLIQKTFSDNSPSVTYTYDDPTTPNSKGRLTKASYAQTANTKFEYDTLGREIKSEKKIDNISYEVQRTYDAAGRLLSVKYPDQDYVYYSYNSAGQIESITNSSIILDYQTKLLLHADGQDGSTNFIDSSASGHSVSAIGDAQIDTSEYKFGGASGLFRVISGNDSYTKLLLHANGPDGSTDFVDSSSSNHTITPYGDVQIDTAQSKFGTASVLFDGDGDYLSVETSDDWNFGSEDFTIDLWVKMIDTPSQCYPPYCYYSLVTHYEGGWNYRTFGIRYNQETDKYMMYFNIYVDQQPTYIQTDTEVALPIDTWYHLAVVRQGNYWRFFANGTQVGSTVENNINIPPISGVLNIGSRGDGNFYFNGWFDEIRVSKGIARWTSDFTPPDLEYGNTSSYLTIPDSPDWNFGSEDFTIDFWVKFNSLDSNQGFMGQSYDGWNFWNLIWLQADHRLYFDSNVDGGQGDGTFYCSFSPDVDTWYHIAVVRSGSDCLMFINGVSQPVTEYIPWGIQGDISDSLKIGYAPDNGSYLNGWLDEIRISKGIARWTSDFTPPQEPYTIESGIGTYYVENVNYNASGQIIKIEYGNGTTTEYTYDPLTLRLTNLRTTDSEQVIIQDLSYQYDSVGNIIQITDSVNTATQSFQYDELNRLVVASGDSYGTRYYDYNEIGNMVLKDGIIYTYGEAEAGPHALTSGSDGSIFEYDLNGNMISWQTADGKIYEYNFDSENRLTQVKIDGELKASFQYDGDGGRTKKIIYTETPVELKSFTNIEDWLQSPLELKRYVFDFRSSFITLITTDMPNEVAEGGYTSASRSLTREVTTFGNKTLMDTDISDRDIRISGYQDISDHLQKKSALICASDISTQLRLGFDNLLGVKQAEASPLLRAHIEPIPQTTIYVGSLYERTNGIPTKHIFLGSQRIASITDGNINYYHANHLGSTDLITDSEGNQLVHYEYAPYGQIVVVEGSDVTDYKFTGKELDSETGLYYYGARYYNPFIGRFITPDTIVQDPYNPQSLNRYSYCLNNPINRIDPSGNWSWKKFWKSFAGAFLGAVVAVVLGPAGLGWSLTAAGFWGGMAGGALTGGLEGGWKGMLIGAAMGGALGGLGGWGIEKFGWQFGAGMLLAGAGVAGATDSWDRFAGGLTGGVTGGALGTGVVKSEQFQNWKAGRGWVSNRFISSSGANQDTVDSTNTYGKFTISVKRGGGSTGMGGSSKGGWGHSWLSYEKGNEGAISRGFWPGEPAGKEAIFGKKYPGVLTKTSGLLDTGINSADATFTWSINETQYNKLMLYIENFELTQKTWSLSVNCTDFPVGAAREIGINVPNVRTGPFEDPNRLANWLDSLK
jgi:RHS repeat-associated protein